MKAAGTDLCAQVYRSRDNPYIRWRFGVAAGFVEAIFLQAVD